ncbi:DNA-binding transcriptional MerR regulator [Nocardia tenerifensis]|uniref:DNA-binding transcriptional MerR regulator n=1 Tax=Nocardia tenerifensis TaxID=228006 RepID=A0A318JVI7_9NOCA|nr:helix-turn-helix domain-containing protein [Nocardia tenerifensis]PXX61041.1 DNA-binding transcriptional MerR regulator [Nocardia tenerifensis]
MELLSIGAFARLARLSPKALRLYADAGLLPPARVDIDTGYRWYSVGQLPKARYIGQLRRLDMPLARIREVLARPGDERVRALAEYWEERRRGFAAQQRLADLLIAQVTGEKVAMYDVSVRTIPDRALLSRTENLTADRIGEFATPLFALFGGPAVPRPEGAAGLPFLRYHGELGPDDEGPVEFCCPITEFDVDTVARRFPDMLVRTEPAAREAYVEVPKSDMTTALGFESLHRWLLDHDERFDWRPRQIFLRDPARAEDSDTIYELAVRLL